jgi:hypothetical protein
MDLDHALAVIRARCEGALSDDELAEIEAAVSDLAPAILLDKDMAEKLMAVIDALEDRVAEMIERVETQHIEEEREAAFVDAAGETLQ